MNRHLAGVLGFYDHHARSGVGVASGLVAWRRVSRGSYKPFLHHVTKGRPIHRHGWLPDRLTRAASEHKVRIKDLVRQPMPHGAHGSMSRMHAVELVFAIGWAAFWIYWLVAAFSMKRGRVPWSRELRVRAVVVVLAILLLRLGAFRDGGLNSDPWRAGLGLFLFALGLGFAIWARLHIGRNWGTPMSQKDEPELVTSGPYRLVRHPIYSGILLAGVGTAVALSWMWLIAMVLAGVYFVYSATIEERYLTKQFPDTYPMYRRSTKMLVPFIF